MFFKYFYLFLLLLSSVSSIAQTEVLGTVLSEDGEPLIGATVMLTKSGNKKGATSDFDGKYDFKNVASGDYTLTVSYIGYFAKTEKFTVGEQEKIVIEIRLVPSTQQLQEVEIIGRKEKGYKNANSFVATKSATKLVDVPQSVSYVTKEVILDQAAYTINDVVKNVSGVNQFSFYNK